MNATLTACDKDSSAGFVKSYTFGSKEEFLEIYQEFKKEIPFRRWYVEVESEDEATELLVEEWWSSEDID